ncbi:MAG: GNAT family N-acetyltransferase [Candidatus Heimdallarchaeota archaeon]
MLAEIEKKDFHKLKSLFSERKYINRFRSHLERTPIPKKVFVDHKKNPQTAVILVSSTQFFGGNADNEEFNKDLRKFIYGEFSQKFNENRGIVINCYISNNDWEKGIESILKNPYFYNHYYYEIKEVKLKN